MKRLIVFLMIIPMIFCGCRDKSRESQTDAFTVSVNVDCENVYGIHIEYLLGGEAMGGKSQVYANGGVLTRGDKLIFSFLLGDFKNPEKLNEKTLQIEFYAITENEMECLINGKEPNKRFTFSENHWEWNASFGGKYEFTLESDNNGGYVLLPAC